MFTCGPPEDAYDSGAYFAAVDHDRARAEALAQVALLLRLERESGGRVRLVRAAEDLDGDGLAAVLHLEGAEPIGPGLDELLVLHAAGLRSLGLVWSRPNAFATGVPFAFPGSPDEGPGLSDAGRALLRACGELGILVDVSHLNAKGFWEVAETGTGPLVASHSGAHALCASPRNLTDDQLRAIGERDGLVGINFHVAFLRADGGEDADTPLARIAEHAAYVAERAGATLRRARLGLRRRDHARRAGRRDRAAAAARRAPRRRVHGRRARGRRVGELAAGPRGGVGGVTREPPRHAEREDPGTAVATRSRPLALAA